MVHKRFILLAFAFVAASTAGAQVKWYDVIPTETSMTYKLVHPLHEIESTSNAVQYKIQADAAKHTVSNVTAQVDVASFNSGNSSRDSHAMEVIDGISYPDAEFTSTNIVQNGDDLQVTGHMTFHGVTKDVTIPVKLNWTADKLYTSGTYDLSLTAFNIERPSLMMIPVEDALHFTWHGAFKLN